MELVITVIGFGNVGKFISSLLLPYQAYRFHLNIIDTDTNVSGAILDLQHGLQLFPQHRIAFNSEALLNQSDFIFHCAGASVPKGKSRLVTCQASIAITEAIFARFRPVKVPFIIVVANPVEIITYVTQRLTGLPPQQVMGTGTFLDSIRMNHLVKARWPSFTAVDAVLLGEHGAAAYLSAQWSTVNGLPFGELVDRPTEDALMKEVKAAAYEIKKTQKATIYGVGYCAVRIFEYLLSPDTSYLPVSTFLPEALHARLEGSKVGLSLFAAVNQKGAFPLENYHPGPDELEALKRAQEAISSSLPSSYA